MSGLVRLFGAGIVLSEALTVALNITMARGASTFALSMSTTISAGVYDLFSFAAKVNEVIRTDIRTKALAAGIDTVPAAASILFKFVFPATWSADPGTNLIDCTFDATGFLEGGLQCDLTVFTLNNTSGWCTKLGLDKESVTTLTGSVASPLGTVEGLFQPRSIFCVENSCRDTWNNEVRPSENTTVLKNGKVRGWSQANPEAYRTIEWVDLPPEVAAGPLDVYTFSAFGANRSILTPASVSVTHLTNVSSISRNLSSALSAGDIVRIGNDDFWSRVISDSVTSIACAEKWPTTIVPTAGDAIEWISEAQALFIEATRTEYLFVYEPIETRGLTRTKAEAYRLFLKGRVEVSFPRRDLWVSLHSVTFPLVLRATPETVQV